MSYILDALKKAESERERGAVPGLNTAQANQATFIHYGRDHKPWGALALVLGILLVTVVALWGWRQSAPNPLTALTNLPAVPASTVAAEVKAPAAVLQKPEPPLRAPVPLPEPAMANRLQPAASTVAHVQAKTAPPPASVAQAVAPIASAPVEAPAKPSPSAVPLRTAAGGTPLLTDLPDSLRRQIPVLNISGAIYSDAPPDWTLIINDQIMGKGSQVAPDLRLEEISASSAVFNFKGQRFRVER